MNKKYLDLDGLEEVVEQINAKYANKNEIPTTPAEVGALPATTKYGASVTASVNTSTYVCTFQLKDQDGNNLGNPTTIDLPIESAIVNIRYNNTTKNLTFTLQNGNTTNVPIGDIISGLQEQLVSGTNIKTVNGVSLLGSGDIDTQGVKEITTPTNIWEMPVGVYKGSYSNFRYSQNSPIGMTNDNGVVIVFKPSALANNQYIATNQYGIIWGTSNGSTTNASREQINFLNVVDTAITTAEIEALF